MDDLLAFAKAQLEIAQKIMLAKGELSPMLIFEAEKGLGVAAVPHYGEPEDKGPLREIMREMLQEMGATRYAFIMEAWVGVKKSMPEPDYLPSNDPERQEAIIVSAAEKGGAKVVLRCTITREGGVGFGEPDSTGITSGPLLELLDQPTRH